MTDKESFLNTLVEQAKTDGKWLTMGVFADWLSDHGEQDLANAYWWCVHYKRFPRWNAMIKHWFWHFTADADFRRTYEINKETASPGFVLPYFLSPCQSFNPGSAILFRAATLNEMFIYLTLTFDTIRIILDMRTKYED